MSEEKSKVTVNPNETEAFEQAIMDAKRENYLGNLEVIEYLLVEYVQRAFARRDTMETNGASQADMADAGRLADIFLGKDDKGYAPVPKWNVDGAIDEHVRDVLNVAGDDAHERMVNAFIMYLMDQYRLLNYAASGAAAEAWEPQVAAQVSFYSNILIGARPPTLEDDDVASALTSTT